MIIWENKINSDHGVVVILGTRYEGMEDEKFEVVDKFLKSNNVLSIMTIDFADEHFNQQKLTKVLRNFIKLHTKTTVINSIHGAQVFWGIDHYSIVGPQVKGSIFSYLGDIGNEITNVMNGNLILSSRVLKAIGNAAKGKPLDVWQLSCQGAKLVEAAQKYLPENSNYVAESKGYINFEIFLNTFIQILKKNQDFTFDELYKNYLEMSTKLSPAMLPGKFDPVKMIVGKSPESALQKTDRFIEEIQAGTANKDKLNQIINHHCEQLAVTKPEFIDDYSKQFLRDKPVYICVNEIHTLINNIKKVKYIGSAAECVDKSNELNYIASVPYDKAITILNHFGYYPSVTPNCFADYFNFRIDELATLAEYYFDSIAETL